ncbi:MAG: hypothetical protein MZV63_12755 [Marinilabiliales bacterium]|nr:hypothetical protein [Marinilabiliales bacterium]
MAEAAAAGDVIAVEALDQTARMIALGIANAVIFSSPETIFLFGGLAKAGDALFDTGKEICRRACTASIQGHIHTSMPSGLPGSTRCHTRRLGSHLER